MKELIPTHDYNGKKAVSAKALYEYLEISEKFTDWAKRMFDYGFIENQDYVSLSVKSDKPKGGRPSVDYALTISCSKEISMLQRSKKGKRARQYFISCEEELKNQDRGELNAYRQSARKRLLKSSELKETDILINELIKKRNIIRRELNEIDRSDFMQLSLSFSTTENPLSLNPFNDGRYYERTNEF